MTAPDQATMAQLRFVHIEKLYGHLPGLAAALPSMFGLSPGEYQRIRDEFATTARLAAAELLDDAGFADGVAALPFRAGDRVLTVGDSITDDLQSWAEILRHALALARPDAPVAVVNAGLSAHTTAMVLRRWPSMLVPSPDWVLCALGGNDVTRIAGGKPQAGTPESVANLLELRRIAEDRGVHRWTWLTPVPVDEARVREYEPFRYGASSWHNDDILALAAGVRSFADPVVDLVATFGVPPEPALQGPDGVHPTVRGQQAIAAAVVASLAGR